MYFIELAKTGNVKIKQTPDLSASVIGLDKHGRSKIPGTFDINYIGRGRDDRYLTGIDEKCYEVQMMYLTDKVAAAKREAELLKIRLDLQIKLGVPDLSATSDYWLNYKVPLHSLKTLDLSQAKHELAIRVMIANKWIMPNEGSANQPQYLRTKFYLHDTVVESDRAVSSTADKDKAFADLYHMYSTEDPRLFAIGRLLFRGRVKADMVFSTMYTQFKAWLITEKKQENSKEFNELSALPNAILTIRDVILSASEKGLIKQKQKKFFFNEHPLGRTLDEVYKNMMKDEFTVTYQMIVDSLEKND